MSIRIPRVTALKLILFALASSMTVTTAFAVVLAHDKSDAKAIELGQRFKAVGTVVPDGGCTLIAREWVLTAAHVVHGKDETDVKVRFGDHEYAVRNIIIHPEGKMQANRPPDVDMALMRLAEAVEGVPTAKPCAKSIAKGQAVYVVGSGDVGDGKSRPRRSDGKRRAATNTIERVEQNHLFIKFDKPPRGTRLEGIGGPGDSGGPLLIENTDGVQVVGVSSGSMGKEGHYGIIDVYVRVSAFTQWIDETIADHQ